jgi:hypothetical protein
MQSHRTTRLGVVTALGLAIGLLLTPTAAWAHCDGMDGPVVRAAQKALETNNLNHVLLWVRAQDEPEIRHAFDHTVRVRGLSADAQLLADRFFFEMVVRIHREGEGAAYTGLKPAGQDLGPSIPAADRSVHSGSVDEVEQILMHAVRDGLRQRFHELQATRGFDPDDVQASRAWVEAYVAYLHYVEGIFHAARGQVHGHDSHGGAHAGGSAHHGH